ncbi:biotin/lipoyl-containing protein [Candidatus Cryosericum odellii]|jgi:glutaconyl-CoA decarboxylase|uniref:Acetyl-CoA carboxylase biotin carboxyl carrier protein subunit n=1 Tax=Candidatus Cryosericum odellii TaxID=2290917 RepID=A0A398DHF4_9BACT|nr:acetyl-CoA carboxylase biotin carboxyl carrier protein subunit [Candidatus Cryosericum odellii]RIE09950.1 acetyl-CoA carboxylase biotin carboxyl carrier protein subunit [Candidatus Cryosericum odellii]RIE14595.1 acetyl-CoA carboxylase biotin carboxyl carrier protein subunit [Candidatus Cryosericum odellii]
MKKYRITVNGKTFDVDVEEAGAGVQKLEHSPVSIPEAVASAPVVAPAPAPVPAPRTVSAQAPAASPTAPIPVASAGGVTAMKSPLPGKILKVIATPGSSWKKGDTLLIIEAMKMENEILAPRDCTVEEVAVESNQTVKTGDLLLKLA